MKFDVVVGNPPYNNDIYLDFVQLGYQLSSKYTCMITPAKWQAKGGEKNEQFRQNIVPHMSKIVYYRNCADIFDIGIVGGITYYITDKNVHLDKIINKRLIPNWNSKFGFELSDNELSILSKVLNNTTNNIINSSFKPCLAWNTALDFGDHSKIDMEDVSSKYILMDSKQSIHLRECYIKDINNCSKYQLINVRWFNEKFSGKILEPNHIIVRNNMTIFAGTLDEVKSAYSYYSCRLIWWLVYRFFHVGTINTYAFEFVPDPGAFDHIFTDEELYKKYNLTEEEINIIESVIKERK